MSGTETLTPHPHERSGHTLLSRIENELAAFKQWSRMDEGASHCHKPDCAWVGLRNLTGLQHVPHLRPNPELSGIGVILGFSITAYLTLVLLILHYVVVHDYCRRSSDGRQHVSIVDRGVLTFLRERVLSWSPSRRFKYSMEKAVLILSDTQLVTGLAFLIGGYSQLNCGISAYHWQIMVYVAWFSSFSFLSAMTFLEDYFQTNQSLRTIRLFFMFVLGSFLIVALLPTGSNNWLNILPGEGGFYPSLDAKCYYEQMTTDRYHIRGGPKIWSMVISILVVGISYLHSGIRLFDPTAELTRKYFRAWPGGYAKRLLYLLEKKASRRGLPGRSWAIPYLLVFAGFTSLRALYDILESMLMEVIWLTFAMGWGTVKLWSTRSSVTYDVNGNEVGANLDVLEEDFWSFGQILPLVLLLLPVLSMAQTYLDNDAKTVDAAHKAELAEKQAEARCKLGEAYPKGASIAEAEDEREAASAPGPDHRGSASLSITPYIRPDERHPPTTSKTRSGRHISPEPGSSLPSTSALPMHNQVNSLKRLHLPQYPYASFASYPWYRDHILLLTLQILMLAAFHLFLLAQVGTFLGLSVFVHNRLSLAWALAVVPAASLLHLAFWYLGACRAKALGSDYLSGSNHRREFDAENTPAKGGDVEGVTDPRPGKRRAWRGEHSNGQGILWFLRMFLVAGLLVFTFFASVEIAGPNFLIFYED